MRKWVYSFGSGHAEGDASEVVLLGSKGANLAELSSLGLPVPPGMTIITEACTWFHDHGGHFPDSLKEQVTSALNALGAVQGASLGSIENPLLLSVRAGSRRPIPGMIETILNLGLNDDTVEVFARNTGDTNFAWNSYRRFIVAYADIVMGLDHGALEELLEERLGEEFVHADKHGEDDWRSLIACCKDIIREELDEEFPQDAEAQLWQAITAAFKSWTAPRAVAYRQMHGLSSDWGTAVNIQQMVFGNRNDASAVGNAFTRNPKTGVPGVTGEFLPKAQGYDLTAGRREASKI